MKRFLQVIHRSHWTVYAASWIFGVSLLGALLGAIFFPLGGWVLHADRTPVTLLVRGLRFGSFWFFIWAPAIAITACVMRSYRRKYPDAENR